MKGFYITIKNGLLDPKHFKAMGGDRDMGTVWLFMWLLDKMTIIDEEKGEGKVLGGRPVKFEEFKKEIPISRTTYVEWIKLLRKGNYIKTERTPYGLIFIVYKAFKIFGQKIDKNRKIVKDTSIKDRSTIARSSVCGGGRSSNYNNTVNNTIPLSKDRGLDKPTRDKISYKKEVYDVILKTYQHLREIELQGAEFDPVMQTIKTMLMSRRKPEEIIGCMKWLAASGEEWMENWTIRTVRIKLPFYLSKINNKPKVLKL